MCSFAARATRRKAPAAATPAIAPNESIPFHWFEQVEYARNAINLGSTAVGVKTKEGILLAVEKRVTSVLLDASSVRVLEVSLSILAVVGIRQVAR